MWFILAISSAFLGAIFYILRKYFLKEINEYVLGAGVSLSSLFILFIISLIKGIPDLNLTFLYAAIITAFFDTIAIILIFKALKISDASLVLPVLSFSPIFLILTSFLILGEISTKIGALGISLIVIGSYVLNFESLKFKKILYPFKKLFSERGMVYMLAVAFLLSISANFAKLAIVNSDPVFSLAMILLLTSIFFIIISTIKKQEFFRNFKINFSKFFAAGFVSALSGLALSVAFTLQIVPYVIATRRTSVLFSVILGFLIFGEKNRIKRFLGALIMVLGVISILLGG